MNQERAASRQRRFDHETAAEATDPVDNLVWGWGEIITNDTIGGAGSEENWVIKGIGEPR